MPSERLQKILARAGIASRRKAEALLEAGRVKVNGVVQSVGAQADPEQDQIAVDGKPLQLPKAFHYYAYYKPRGLVVTKNDELGRKGIFADLNLPPAVNAVGRLDKDSEGLLLLSNDGEFIQRYTHPRFQVPKYYHVQISRLLTPGEKRRLLLGIPLEQKKARAVTITQWQEGEHYWLALELREGMKREIRRMLKFFGVAVLRLVRVQHGAIELGDLQPGALKELPGCPS